MKNIEIKVYTDKLKMMRDENSIVRMQLLDPSSIKRLICIFVFLGSQTYHFMGTGHSRANCTLGSKSFESRNTSFWTRKERSDRNKYVLITCFHEFCNYESTKKKSKLLFELF